MSALFYGRRMSSNTTAGVHAGSVTSVEPEFVDIPDAIRFSSLGRTRLYEEVSSGRIKSVLLRKPGAARGRRLIHLASLRAYLLSFQEGATA